MSIRFTYKNIFHFSVTHYPTSRMQRIKIFQFDSYPRQIHLPSASSGTSYLKTIFPIKKESITQPWVSAETTGTPLVDWLSISPRTSIIDCESLLSVFIFLSSLLGITWRGLSADFESWKISDSVHAGMLTIWKIKELSGDTVRHQAFLMLFSLFWIQTHRILLKFPLVTAIYGHMRSFTYYIKSKEKLRKFCSIAVWMKSRITYLVLL